MMVHLKVSGQQQPVVRAQSPPNEPSYAKPNKSRNAGQSQMSNAGGDCALTTGCCCPETLNSDKVAIKSSSSLVADEACFGCGIVAGDAGCWLYPLSSCDNV